MDANLKTEQTVFRYFDGHYCQRSLQLAYTWLTAWVIWHAVAATKSKSQAVQSRMGGGLSGVIRS